MKNYTIFLLAILIFACTKKQSKSNTDIDLITEKFKLTASEISEIREVSNFKEIDGVQYRLTYLKPDFIRKIYGENSKEYDQFSCFYLDIVTENFSDITEYPSVKFDNLNQRVNFLSFLIKDYVIIKGNSKTYNCINSIFDRNFGKSNVARFFLVFNKIPEENLTFNFYDDYFENGEIKLKLKI